ncbi:Cas10/Cmr2 second palm domain-containing protein [Emticicia sp. BO119]|uniref:Cas10/Cmr2 second palm domain-containing protein n=1 Tax=Emticicia sp. BO119 TaxID=2757768 RepID=UPI0015F0EA94|nr:CRISPR-associated protein [Emticicia sp. BO119]MBA4848970.1 CRISPR-associated protein [Emticicia sp. BO119]
MSYFLYGASVQGIQDFIFQTNKLKEIGGGSELVEQICSSKFFEEAGILPNDGNIIINAAGNIKYLFEDEVKCKALVRKFPKSIAEFAPGITLSQAVVKFDESEKLSDAINKLEDSLKAQRNKVQSPFEIGFMGLERARRTGGVGVEYLENEVIDASIQAKLDAFDESIKRIKPSNSKAPGEGNSEIYSNLYLKFFGGKLKAQQIPLDLNEISKDSSNPWLAVIHADGNGLGKLVQQLGNVLKEKDTELSKNTFARFSRELDNATQTAAKRAFEKLDLIISTEEKYPLRPIILGGDDITLIIRADLAFDFTVNFLEEFENQTESKLSFLSKDFGLTEFEEGLTACAGIAYIKYSYPIHYGLHLAEELTKKAKRTSRSTVPEGVLAPSSLSFYKVHSSFIENLEEIEKKTLTAGSLSFDYGPYFLSERYNHPTVNNLSDLIKVLEASKDEKSKGVSKLRQWVSELYKNESTADFMLKRMKEIDGDFFKKMKLDSAIAKEDMTNADGKTTGLKGKTIIYDVLQLFSFL